jgi:hypothetical protein
VGCSDRRFVAAGATADNDEIEVAQRPSLA